MVKSLYKKYDYQLSHAVTRVVYSGQALPVLYISRSNYATRRIAQCE